MSIECIDYLPEFEKDWEDIVMGNNLHTVLHSRRFLEYHGDRFEDCSLVIRDAKANHTLAVMPAARHPAQADLAVSHPGSTFGGLLQRKLDPFAYPEFLDLAMDRLRARGFARLRLKATPSFASAQANEITLHHGLRHGNLQSADLWSFVQLDRPFALAANRRAAVRQARNRNGITAAPAQGAADWQAFYAMLETNLRDRHDVTPVHSFDEFLDVRDRLGERSTLMLARDAAGSVCAGVWLIHYNDLAVHCQYIASTQDGRQSNAVDLVLSDAMDLAAAQNVRVFSFGISSEGDCWHVNEHLLRYKARFGSGLCLHQVFDYTL